MNRLKLFMTILDSGVDTRKACIEAGFRSFDECREKLLCLADSLPRGGFDGDTRGPEPANEKSCRDETESMSVHTDGASRGNPGPASAAAIAYSPGGEMLAARSAALGKATNNEAEYRGLILGLRLAEHLGARRVTIRMDSELVVRQMKGEYKIRNSRLGELAEEARRAASFFERVGYEHVSREQNLDADRLANEVLDAAAGS
ncbi:MAG: ribonuclease HI family protein [Candidatus Dadabacteria bacterium]|nr:ribonuclease HI family protein [Candidatus Dadabacteria bacterium]